MRRAIGIMFIGIFCAVFVSGNGPLMAQQHKQVKIQLLTAPMGTGAYFFSFKLAEEVNQNHPWLHIETKEGMGTVPQMLEMMNNPKLGTTTIWNSVSPIVQFARTATHPFKTTYQKATGSKVLMLFNTYPNLVYFATTNPEIKTVEDLAGKKVVLAQKGMVASYLIEKILEKKGLLSKIKKQYMGFRAASDALRDGLADAVVLIGYTTDKTDEFSVMAAYHELFNMRTVYPVSLGDQEVLNELVREGVPVYPATIPKGSKLMGKVIPSDITVYYQGVVYVADAKMDDEIIYEVTKNVYDHMDAIKEAHPSLKAATREKLANVESEKTFHPGAIKFYKEKGVPIGFTGL